MKSRVRLSALSPAAPIAEGALSALLFAASLWVQPFGFLVCLFSPLPIAVAAWRSGRVGAGLAAMAGAAAIWATAGLGAAAVYTLYFVAGGCYLGLACRKGLSPEAMVGGFAAATVLAFGVTLGIQSAQAGVGPMDYLSEGFRQSAGHLRELLRQSDASPDLTETLNQWADHFSRAFPGAVAALAILTGWANGLGLRKAIRVRGGFTGPWNTWRARENWIWMLIASGLGALLAKGTIGTIALNIFIPALAVYFLQGLAIVQHLFEAKAFPRMLRIVTYVLLFFQLPVMLLIAGVGAFDLWLDFRSRWSSGPATGART